MGAGMGPYPPTSPVGPGPTTVPRYTTREMRTERHFKPGWLLSAFAFGAAIGGVLGMLFAPRRGSEIREMLAENIGGEGVSREWRAKVNQAISSGRARPGDLASQAQRELDELRNQAVSRIDDAKLRSKILQKQAELRYLQGKEKLRHF
jgi:gas vesicle protein